MNKKFGTTVIIALLFGYAYLNATNTFPSSGNVGINDSSPSALLSIHGYTPPTGNIWGAGESIIFHNGSLGDNGSYGLWLKWNMYREAGTANYRYLDFSDRPNAAEMYIYDGNFAFRTVEYTGSAGDIISPAYRMLIKANGNVGIGTTSPDYKLDVLGTIRANEVIVETGWSDFVFQEDYQLRTLGEVASFIDENGHLPDIPSAEEVEARGVTLGRINSKLLQKVEELTLYTIDQENRLETQQDQLAKQQQLIDQLLEANAQLSTDVNALKKTLPQ